MNVLRGGDGGVQSVLLLHNLLLRDKAKSSSGQEHTNTHTYTHIHTHTHTYTHTHTHTHTITNGFCSSDKKLWLSTGTSTVLGSPTFQSKTSHNKEETLLSIKSNAPAKVTTTPENGSLKATACEHSLEDFIQSGNVLSRWPHSYISLLFESETQGQTQSRSSGERKAVWIWLTHERTRMLRIKSVWSHKRTLFINACLII